MEDKQLNKEKEEFDGIDLLIVLAKRKKMIIGITAVTAISAAIISLCMSPIYRAETKILSPQQSSSMASQLQMMGQLGAAIGLPGASFGIKNTNDLYVRLLKSRPVMDRIVDRFDLMKLYDDTYREDARCDLLKKLTVLDDKKSGIISIGVEDNDPKRSADMTNAFIEELRILNKGLSVSEAAQRRLFFEEQLNDSKEALLRAEEAMKDFQEKTGALKMDAQATVAIEGISRLRAQIAAREVQVRVMKTYATSQNPDIQRYEEELKGMRDQLGRLESKNSAYNPIVPTGTFPAVGTEYMRRMRDLKFNETLYELLLKQFEAAKLDEARDATVVQVIEKAIPPEKKVKPKRTLMIVFATLTGLIVSIMVAFAMDYKERAAEDSENSRRFETLKRFLSFRRL